MPVNSRSSGGARQSTTSHMLPGLLRVKARVGSQLLTGLVRPEVRMIANGSFGKSEAGGACVTHPLPPPRKKGGGGGMGEGVGGGVQGGFA